MCDNFYRILILSLSAPQIASFGVGGHAALQQALSLRFRVPPALAAVDVRRQ
jgi:hypothetical protein